MFRQRFNAAALVQRMGGHACRQLRRSESPGPCEEDVCLARDE